MEFTLIRCGDLALTETELRDMKKRVQEKIINIHKLLDCKEVIEAYKPILKSMLKNLECFSNKLTKLEEEYSKGELKKVTL